ncbi:MAG: hypothetical protein J5I92_11360 [Thiogranum sp.]|nr:hypothetical protein [Thiogranum sp.]
MTAQLLRVSAFAAGMLLLCDALADEICANKKEFEKNGWQLEPVQQAMDNTMRDHRMRANWLKQPRPPSAVGRDYYEWLWMSEFGAAMKADLVQHYCGGAVDSGANE